MVLKIKLKIRRDSGSSAGSSSRPSTPAPPADGVEDQGGEEEEEKRKHDEYILSLWKSFDEEEEEEEEPFFAVYISQQVKRRPYIARQSHKPLSLRKYLKLHRRWPQLLQGKRTYLRPPEDRRKKGRSKKRHGGKGKDLFRAPEAKTPTLECQEPPLALKAEYAANNKIVQEKIKILSEKYALFRRTRKDGSCFYRGFFFSYMEHLVGMQDEVEVEVARLMKCVAKSKEDFLSLGGTEEHFSYAISEFEHLVKSIAKGLTTEDLYQRNLQENMSSSILSFLRLLTEIELHKREDFYKPYFNVAGHETALEFCKEEVRPRDSEADQLQIVALSNALGIPLRVEYLDASILPSGVVQLNHHDFIPQPESELSPASTPLQPRDSVSSASISGTTTVTAMKPLEQPSDSGSVPSTSGAALDTQSSDTAEVDVTDTSRSDSTPPRGGSDEQAGASTSVTLSSSERRLLVTLLYRPGHYDILYPK